MTSDWASLQGYRSLLLHTNAGYCVLDLRRFDWVLPLDGNSTWKCFYDSERLGSEPLIFKILCFGFPPIFFSQFYKEGQL